MLKYLVVLVPVAFLVVVTGARAAAQLPVPADPKKAAIESVNRGAALSSKNEFDKAIKEYDEAIRLDPDLGAAYVNRGAAWSGKKEYDKAIKDFGEAIRLNPKDAVAFSNRGDAWNNKKEYEKAIKDFGEAIRLNPKFTSAYYNITCTLALQGKTDAAIDMLAKTLELGYRNIEHIKKDTDLDSIRKDTRYLELLKKYSK